MLQRVEFDHDDDLADEGSSTYFLQLSYYTQLIKRRWLYFILPCLAVLLVGTPIAFLLPATYLSEGKILVQSQQIPTELVRPTVTSSAQERIQVIEQRTMTRDNLIGIVDKFRLFPKKRDFMSPTELVTEIRKRVRITAIDQTLDFKQRSRQDNPAIVFSVGFEYEEPAVAAQVANEIITRILSEDLRDRTSRANDTTKFLAREVERLKAENVAFDARIARAKPAEARPSSIPSDQTTATLNQLRIELAQKSSLYSPRHPTIQVLKKQIEAMEATAAPAAALAGTRAEAMSENRDALIAQQEAVQKNLEGATAKLAVARLGETLEKDQQSEKLEVIEQPAVPQQPIKPNRGKLMGLIALASIASGLGLAFVTEFADKTIRRTSDLAKLFDNRLVIGIPVITIPAEEKARRLRILALVVLLIAALAAGAGAIYFYLPLDLIIAKARVGMFRLN